jgi:uncharacterized protein YjbJ (UPF0337 family)
MIHARGADMSRAKTAADRIAGKTKEAVAEIIGDGALQREGSKQQGKGEPGQDEQHGVRSLDTLDKLT